jgi:hypothetical protein
MASILIFSCALPSYAGTTAKLPLGGAPHSAPEPLSANKASATKVSVSPGSPATFGTTVTIAATVTPGATGTVKFLYAGSGPYVGILNCGLQLIVNSAATCVTSSLPGGTTGVEASYSGDNEFKPSTSVAYTYVVNEARSLMCQYIQMQATTANVTTSALQQVDAGFLSFYKSDYGLRGNFVGANSAMTGTCANLGTEIQIVQSKLTTYKAASTPPAKKSALNALVSAQNTEAFILGQYFAAQAILNLYGTSVYMNPSDELTSTFDAIKSGLDALPTFEYGVSGGESGGDADGGGGE